MSRLRLFLACLVMAALPLQGFAAASMLFCGMGQLEGAAHHNHAGHEHPIPDVPQAGLGHSDHPKADQEKQGHACPVCASCCHVVAIGAFQSLQLTAHAPAVQPPASIVRVTTRTTTPPDKPPRV